MEEEAELIFSEESSSAAESESTSLGDGGKFTAGPSIYSAEVSARIKEKILLEWERQKEFRGATQADLSEVLGISQGAVSKLLNNATSHPWTVDKIEKFSKFCDVPIEELVEENRLFGHFNGWNGDNIPPDRRRIDEARAALQKFVDDTGSEIDDVKLHRLAGKLAIRVEGSNRTPKIYAQEIMKLLIAEA